MSDSDIESPGLSPNWGHYENLARFMFDVANKKKRYPGELEGLMASVITATEKLDGSNLSMWVRYVPKLGDRADPNNWEVCLLQGRNSPLWQKSGFELYANNDDDGDDSGEAAADESISVEEIRAQLQADLKKLTALPGYGNAGSLQKLLIKMRDFIVRVANILKEDSIQIFGEAFRPKAFQEFTNAKKEVKKLEQAAERASWHPFGIKIPVNGKMKLTRLTAATHKVFSDAVDQTVVPKLPTNHQELIDVLMAAKDYVVCPPPIYCAKVPLVDAIQAVAPTLLNPPERAFEGVFVVHEEGWFGVKFKAGSHDEQGRIAALDELGLEVSTDASAAASSSTTDDTNSSAIPNKTSLTDAEKKIAESYKLMLQIFKAKIPLDKSVVKAKPAADPAMAEKKKIDMLIAADCEKAVQREFSKRLSFDHIEKPNRQPVVDQLIPLVLKEVMQVYQEDGVKMPYSEDQLKAKCANVVKSSVMKVPFVEQKKEGDKNDDDG